MTSGSPRLPKLLLISSQKPACRTEASLKGTSTNEQKPPDDVVSIKVSWHLQL